MHLYREEEILDLGVRQKILKEIQGSENSGRKKEAKRRYDVYKDNTKQHVVAGLLSEGLRPETVAQMSNRAGNISICRKIVNKKAKAYAGGVRREATPDSAATQVDQLSRLLNFDQRMKKGDRYRELYKNCLYQIAPEIDVAESMIDSPVYRLKFATIPPWQYDVVEDAFDRERPMVVILSDFLSQGVGGAASEAKAGVHPGNAAVATTNRKDDIIADSPSDAGLGGRQQFVWWTNLYHFTTDKDGNVLPGISPAELLNPIGMLPFANNAEGQDGQFWAAGGDDLVDGSILINKMITDMNFIAYLQGYGQPVITGQNLSNERFKFGPNNALVLEYDPSKEEPQPTVEFVSASPPLDSWMRMIEQYMALLLTTNNLSSANVSGELAAQSFPSGIAMLIEQAESTEDVNDKQRDYVDKERDLWEITKRWFNLYEATGSLCDEFAEVKKLPDDLEVTVKFTESKPAITETERLENIKRRKELGINEMVDLIMLDNPDMTKEEAEEKLLRITDERLKKVDAQITSAIRDTPRNGDVPQDNDDDMS